MICWKKICFAIMENMQVDTEKTKKITIYTIYKILYSCRNQSIDLECKPFNCFICKGTIAFKSFQFFWSELCSHGSFAVIYIITLSTDWVKYKLPTKPCIYAIFDIKASKALTWNFFISCYKASFLVALLYFHNETFLKIESDKN